MKTQAYSPAQSAPEIASSKWHVLIAAWLGTVFDGFDAALFTIVLFPAMSELLGTTSHSIIGIYGSIIIAALLIGYFVGGVSFGMLADKIGRTKTMSLTILLYATFTGLCSFSHNWMDLAFYRFLVGCGIGGEITVAGVMLAETWNSKTRIPAMGFYISAFPAGVCLAALLNLCIGNMGWRWMFVAGIIPALLTIYIRTKLKEPIAFALAPRVSFTLPQIFNTQNRGRTFLAFCLGSTAIVGYWALLSWVSPWINQLTGTKAVTERSYAFFTMNIGGILGSIAAGPLVIYLGRKKAFLITFTGALVSCLGMFLTTKSFGPELLVWAFFVGAFTGLPFALLMIYLPELFDAQIRGTAVGFTYNAGRLIGAAAALGSGQLIAFFGGSYASAGTCGALIYAIGIISALFIKPISNSLEQIQILAPTEYSHEPEFAHHT